MQAGKAVKEFLYDTSKKEFRVQRLDKKNNMAALKQKCNKPFVDYRNSGTGLPACGKFLQTF
jgi:hypothetical protein